MSLRLTVAGPQDAALFGRVAEDVFDNPIDPDLLRRYLASPTMHIVLALQDDLLVGFCSGLVHFHPDKPEDFFINELGVARAWRRQGIATALIHATCDLARGLGCRQAWVVAEPTDAAMGFYRSLKVPQTGTNLAMFTFDLAGDAGR
ncbi:GNAT family N-acetyltransferase [Palleronia sp. KMU-117]|uniref:GNAT family N-acetyltransferase n=1 Tax=Palleronia sp. KMU-117 TaxID=3434108 RepID=UPI003D74BBCB